MEDTDGLEVEEIQSNSQHFCRELSCETTTTRKVTANHLYIPGQVYLFCFVAATQTHAAEVCSYSLRQPCY